MSAPLRVLLADDEAAARATLRALLAGLDGAVLVGEAEDGEEALALTRAYRPDVLLLDVQMPGPSGLDVLRRLEAEAHRPAVVLTTAFDEYAVAAFEWGALDYLLKPFGRARLARALARAAERGPATGVSLAERAGWAAGLGERPPDRLFVHDRGRIVAVPLHDIVRIEGADDYAAVHTTRGGPYLVGLTLQAFEERLDPARWVRVHRSHLVHLAHVRALVPHPGRRLALEMADGARVVASRAATPALRRLAI